MKRVAMGIDAGGTFTDSVLWDLDACRVVAKAKAPTTYHDLAEGIVASIDALPPERFDQVGLVCLSTTLATNATVEGRGAPVGLLVMGYPGFDPAGLGLEPLAILPGRMTIDGQEAEPIDPDATRAAVRRLVAEDGVAAVAISGYASVVNPEHELAVRELVQREAAVPAVCGHELSARLNFLHRARTAVLNARLLPIIRELLDAVRTALTRRQLDVPLMVVKGDGTLVHEAVARQRPIDTILSGPAASAVGARILAGLTEAVVVDVGGTTTDIAVLEAGQVALNPDGAMVGPWQTSVEAVDMQTSGLGGDSYLQVTRRLELVVGPRRVMPLSCLVHRHPAAMEDLRRAIAQGPAGPPHAQLDFFRLVQVPAGFHPTDREREIIDRLREGPTSRWELARLFHYVDPSVVRVHRLEERRIVERAGLTPTDVFHVTGTYAAWSVEAADMALTALAGWMHTDRRTLIERVQAELGRLTTERIVERMLRRSWSGPDGRPAGSVGDLLWNALVGRRRLAGLDVKATLDRPVIGIGAPVGQFVPEAARQLGCRWVIPDHADVANAVGAAASQVVVHRQVGIAPDADGFYALTTDTGRRRFADLEAAEHFARQFLTERLRRQALQAGTRQQHVTLTARPRWAPLADGTMQLIELVVDGRLVGHPLD